MKIMFDDGSFLEITSSKDNKLTIILCGFKNPKQLTMSSSELNPDQVLKLIEFLQQWHGSIGVST